MVSLPGQLYRPAEKLTAAFSLPLLARLPVMPAFRVRNIKSCRTASRCSRLPRMPGPSFVLSHRPVRRFTPSSQQSGNHSKNIDHAHRFLSSDKAAYLCFTRWLRFE
jgi:hypothetical protein